MPAGPHSAAMPEPITVTGNRFGPYSAEIHPIANMKTCADQSGINAVASAQSIEHGTRRR